MFDLEILSSSAVASSPSTLTSSISALDNDTIYYKESTENIEGRVQKTVKISVLAPDRSLLFYQHM